MEIKQQQLSVAGFLEALAAALSLPAPSPSSSQQLSQVGNPSSYQSGISDVSGTRFRGAQVSGRVSCSTADSGGCTPRATRAMARGSAQKITEEAQKIAEEE